jgi:hypothetical protein
VNHKFSLKSINTRAVHKETELFLKIYCFTYNLIKLVSFLVLPSTLDTPRPTSFAVLESSLERVLWDGAKVTYRNFLSSLPSEICELLVRILTSWTRKSLQGLQIWRLGRVGIQVVSCFVKNSRIRSDPWAGALSWCGVQVLIVQASVLFLSHPQT